MKKEFELLLSTLISITTLISAQPIQRDTAEFIEKRNGFFDSVKTSLDAFYKKDGTGKKGIVVDFESFNPPNSKDEFKSYWHNQPISQAVSGMCWCFSTTSFFESEIYRISKREIKLSELFTVYWEYVEKARVWRRFRVRCSNTNLEESWNCPCIRLYRLIERSAVS